jgi:hypothetical protein
MSQQNLLELAKQGHPDAIAALINRNLQPKGITAKVSRKGRCLKIILESNKVHNQESLIKFVHGGVLKLEIDEIDILQISAEKTGVKTPVWTQTINLKPAPKDLMPQTLKDERVLETQTSKDESDRQISSTGKPIQTKETATGYGFLIILLVFTLGFVGWLLTTEGYQATLQEMPFSRAFGQLVSSLFDSTSDKSSGNNYSLPDEKTSYTRVGDLEDVSYGNVKRLAVRIVVPLGRTQDELTATLKRAANEIGEETQANAVMVFAYRPQDTPSDQYTAGRAVYAPNGRWEDAASSDQKQISVDLNTLYFSTPLEVFSVGTRVTLSNSTNQEINLSKEYSSWGDQDIVASVSSGTDATVLEHRSEPMGEQEFVRYKVQVISDGETINGWVHSYNVLGQ